MGRLILEPLLSTLLDVLIGNRSWLDLRGEYLLDRHRKGLHGNRGCKLHRIEQIRITFSQLLIDKGVFLKHQRIKIQSRHQIGRQMRLDQISSRMRMRERVVEQVVVRRGGRKSPARQVPLAFGHNALNPGGLGAEPPRRTASVFYSFTKLNLTEVYASYAELKHL